MITYLSTYVKYLFLLKLVNKILINLFLHLVYLIYYYYYYYKIDFYRNVFIYSWANQKVYITYDKLIIIIWE